MCLLRQACFDFVQHIAVHRNCVILFHNIEFFGRNYFLIIFDTDNINTI
jgi:hypothetical protein